MTTTDDIPSTIFGPEHTPGRDPVERTPADLRVALIVVCGGIAFDLAAQRQVASTATALAIAVTSVGLLASKRLDTRLSRALVAAAPVFGLWAAIRASSWLLPLDVIAAVALLTVGTGLSTTRSAWRYGLRDLAAQPARLLSDIGRGPAFVARPTIAAAATGAPGRPRSIASGLALAAPVTVILVTLLASGDALTASALRWFNGEAMAGHVVAGVAGAVGILGLLFRASRPDDEPVRPLQYSLGSTEAAVVLASVVAVLAAFALLQVAGAVGVGDHILEDPTETSDWARRGFFQLLWAAGFTLSVVLVIEALSGVHGRGPRTTLRGLSAAASALTLVVVGSAIVRIVAYSQTFGLTMLRLYSGLFGCWIAAVFVLFALRATNPARFSGWFVPGGLGIGLALLLALNIVNPEAIVVRYDVARESTFDPEYLTDRLSDDSIPTLVNSLPGLDPDFAQDITRRLCARERSGPDGALSWNLAQSRARESLEELCG